MPVTSVAKALFALQHAGLEGRMRITFELFDTDRSGRIDEQELFEILKVRHVAANAHYCWRPASLGVRLLQLKAATQSCRQWRVVNSTYV